MLGGCVQVAFVAFRDADVLERVLDQKQMRIEGCLVRLIRAEKRESRPPMPGDRQDRPPMGRSGGAGAMPNAAPFQREGPPVAQLPPPRHSPPRHSPPRGHRSPPPRHSPPRGRSPPPRHSPPRHRSPPPRHSPPFGRSAPPPRGTAGENAHDFGGGLGKRERGGEGGVSKGADSAEAALQSPGRPMAGVGMTLDQAATWSNGCCIVKDIKKGGPVDFSGMVRVGDCLLEVGGVSVVGMTRDVIKNHVMGPVGSRVELVFQRDHHKIRVYLERLAAPKQPQGAEHESSLPSDAGAPPGRSDTHKRPRLEHQLPPSEVQSPRPLAAWDRGDGGDRSSYGKQTAPLSPPHAQRDGRDGGGGDPGRGGWDEGERRLGDGWQDRGRNGATAPPPRDVANDRNDAGRYYPRDQFAPGGGGFGARDGGMRDGPPVGRDERDFGRRDGPMGRGQGGMYDRRLAAPAMPDSPRDYPPMPRGRSRSRSPPRGGGAPYHTDRGPPGGWHRRSPSPPLPLDRGPIGVGGPGGPGALGPGGPGGPNFGPRTLNPRLQENRIFLTATTGGTRWLHEAAIKGAMMSFGNVLQVFMPAGKKFAYVSFESADGKDAALRTHEVMVEGCTVLMEAAKAREGPPGLADRDGRDSRQFSGVHRDNRGDNRDFRDERRSFSSAEAQQFSQRKRHSTRSFSPCSSLKSPVVQDKMGVSELRLNLTAGDCAVAGKHVKQHECAPMERTQVDDGTKSSRNNSHYGSAADESRTPAGWMPAVGVGTKSYSGSERSSRDEQQELHLKRKVEADQQQELHPSLTIKRQYQEGYAVGKWSRGTEGDSRARGVSERMGSGGRAEHGRAAGMLIENATCLIKPQIMRAPPLEVMDWIDRASFASLTGRASFASLPLDDLVQCLERFSAILSGADVLEHPALAPVQLQRLLHQCVRLLARAEQFFLAYSANPAPVVTAARDAKHRPRWQQHHRHAGGPGAASSHATLDSESELREDMCGIGDEGCLGSLSGERLESGEAAAALPAAGIAAHDASVVGGRQVSKVLAAVTRVCAAAVQHWFADCTKELARKVCTSSLGALSRMATCVTSHLESAVSDESQGVLLDGRRGFRADDVIAVLRESSRLASALDLVQSSLVKQDFGNRMALQEYVCAVGHWLPLLLSCPESRVRSLVAAREPGVAAHGVRPGALLPQPAPSQQFDSESSAPCDNEFRRSLDRQGSLGAAAGAAGAGAEEAVKSAGHPRTLTPLTIHESVQGQCTVGGQLWRGERWRG